MAVLKSRGGSTAKSNFRQQAVATNSTFGTLAGLMDDAYNFLEPIAIEKMKQKAHEDWGGAAKAAMGDPAGAEVMSSMSTASGPVVPQVTTQPLPTEGQQIAADAMAAIGKGGAKVRMENKGTRSMPITGDLQGRLSSAVAEVYGPGYEAIVYSGGQPGIDEGGARTGSTRHDHGKAADVRVVGPDGKVVSGDALGPLGQYWLAKGYGGVGMEMNGGGIHLDEHKDRARTWDYASKGGQFTPGQRAAVEAGLRGEMPSLAVTLGQATGTPMAAVAPSMAAPDLPGITASTASTPAPAPAPPPPQRTMITTKDGKTEPRLFSPASGPILQAYNAVAAVEYNAGVRLGATKAFVDLSNQFELNPAGFQEAAMGYVEEQVKAAPARFRDELRLELTEEANRRYLGVVEEQHNDLKQRAANSNQALISRESDALTAAMVGGDPAVIATAQAKLYDVLRVRESLPGLAWTPEQSSEVFRKSQEAAAAERERQQKVQTAAWKVDLDTVIKAAGAGLSSSQEALLDNPMVQALMPEKAREALAAVAFRDNLPSFFQMPPAEMDAAIAEWEKAPVQEEWQVDMIKTARKTRDDAQKELDADPVKYAQDRMVTKPPAIIPPTESPQAFIDSLGDRAVYAREMQAAGFTDTPVLLSKEEAEQMGALFGKDVPAIAKAEIAKAIVQGLGPDAAGFFDQAGQKDPIIRYSGMMMASGGSTEIATQAIQGQELLDAGVVQAPSVGGKIEAFAPQMADALKGVVPAGQQGELLQFATAIYATMAQGVTDEGQQKELMAAAVQKALGQTTTPKGALVGGVQKIGEFETLLPPDVSGKAINTALETAWAGRSRSAFGLFGESFGAEADIWGALGQAPHMGGKPVDPAYADYMRLVPLGNDGRYRMEFQNPNGGSEPVMNQDGGFMVFNVDDLLTAATPKAAAPAKTVTDSSVAATPAAPMMEAMTLRETSIPAEYK